MDTTGLISDILHFPFYQTKFSRLYSMCIRQEYLMLLWSLVVNKR
jgi:hypothetical protein